VVGPTKLKPSFLRAALSAADAGVLRRGGAAAQGGA
jgi:hypothetical protein